METTLRSIKMNLRRLCLASLLAALTAAPAASFAQASGGGDVFKIIVPFAPGAATDILARLVGAKVADRLGKKVVVENKAGAGGQLGLQQAVRSPPDGNTVLMTPSGPISISGHITKLPYDTAKDLVPVAMIAYVPTAIAVSPASPHKSLNDLIAVAKSANNDRPILYSVSALATHMHLAGELLKKTTGAKLQAVAYRGAAPASLAIASGEVEAGITDLATLLPLAKGGRLRILAVTGAQRTSTAPDLPTVAELGIPGYSADAWLAMFVPVGTPEAVVERLNAEVAHVLTQPDVKAAMANTGLEPMAMALPELRRFIAEDTKKWGNLIRDSNIKFDN
jgi:tripartite-type tricarboxylate transporter receptor subunit TctC